MTPKLVMTDLNRYSFVDVLKIFTSSPEKCLYEINTKEEPGELPYYRHALKTRKELKKTKAILSFEDVFLKEFNEGKMRTYLFEELTTYQFFRVGDDVFSLEEGCPPYKEFFEKYTTLPKFSSEIINELDPNFKPSTDFVIFKPQKDLYDIVVFEKLVQKI